MGARQLARRLEPVDAGHHHVHEYDVGQFLVGQVDAVAARGGGQHLVAMLRQHVDELMRLRGRVVDNQNSCHGSSRVLQVTSVRMVPRSSSLLNGLVMYRSEPTIRPFALSKSPSLLDSITTGVPLNSLLFLMSAHV